MPAQPVSLPLDRVDAIRRFNRFYTQKIGILQDEYLDSRHSLAEVRVLYELAHRHHTTATELSNELGLDAGYLSRILRAFEKQSLITKKRSAVDGRQSFLELTKRGSQVFRPLELRAQDAIGAMLKNIPETQQIKLVEAMRTIESTLDSKPRQTRPYVLRQHQPGDIGWIVHRHGVLYAKEYGWDEQFEALVAVIAAEFVQKYDAKRERCWIAERDGETLGCVFLVKASDVMAKLRLLLVEPKARGLGIGKRLVEECVRFARAAGYQRITLWTQNILEAARHIYESAGFILVREEPHRSFGHDLVGETWELDLTGSKT